MVSSLNFFCFCMKLCMLPNSRMLISTTLVLWNSSPKYPIKAILVPNLRIFIFRQILCLEKFKGADVKCHSGIAFSSSYPNKTILVLHLKTFFFSRNITFWQTEGAEVTHDNSFSSSSLKIAKYGILSTKVLSTYMKLCINLNLRA